MVYDSNAQAMIVCGNPSSGYSNDIFLNYVDAGVGSWNIILDTGAHRLPSVSHGMAFDSLRQQTVMFGGNNATSSPQTWERGPNFALVLKSAAGPGARDGLAMVFDSVRNQTVLFGGGPITGGATSYDDTWVYDGTTWTQPSTITTRPPARQNHAMAFDSIRGKVVLFGGEFFGGGADTLADTWEFDGLNWTRFNGPGPSKRQGHSMAFDASRGRVVLFGGFDYDATTPAKRFNDTWEFDGTQWRSVTVLAAPPRVRFHTLAYDSTRRKVVLFGGSTDGTPDDLNTTWEYP